MEHDDTGFSNLEIIEYLRNLEQRVSQIEMRLHISPDTERVSKTDGVSGEDQNISEQRIGEFWFANLGILILVFFFTFLIAQPFEEYSQVIPPVIGLAAVLLLIGASKLAQKSYSVISNELYGSGLFILYITALRLFHFTNEPLLVSAVLKPILLIAIPIAVLLISVRRKSLSLNTIGLLLLAATGLILNNEYVVYIILLMLSGAVGYLYTSGVFNRVSYLVMGIVITNISFAAWMLNNPFIGNEILIIEGNTIGILFLLLNMLIFAFVTLKDKTEQEGNFSDLPSLVNVSLSFILFSSYALLSLKESAALFEFIYFAVALGTAVLFWVRKENKLSTYFYSMASFVALSVMILLVEEIPHSLIYLIWQSLIIIGLAVWFKSKSIIISNFIIYMLITLAYFLITKQLELGGLSIGFTALLSARLLNWQKNRLTIKTEFLRNAYLVVAFFSIPLTLLSTLEGKYIGLALIGLALLYYLMAILLTNFKYRWMAHLTLLSSIVYIFIFWFQNGSSFLHLGTLAALAVTLIFVSVFFTKMRIKDKSLQ